MNRKHDGKFFLLIILAKIKNARLFIQELQIMYLSP